jgi:AcrR family transcriptional regulator
MTAATLPEPSTRQRLLDAALLICARRGLRGSTTREIAEAAQVNEVTLFRQFGSKEKLLAALVQRSVATQVEALSNADPLQNELRADLRGFASRFDRMLVESEPLVRAVIGESSRHPEEARQVISEAARPLRERLGHYIAEAQASGAVRPDLAIEPAVDCFTGMLLGGMLKRTGGLQVLSYDAEEYLDTCVDLFVRGIEAHAAQKR